MLEDIGDYDANLCNGNKRVEKIVIRKSKQKNHKNHHHHYTIIISYSSKSSLNNQHQHHHQHCHHNHHNHQHNHIGYMVTHGVPVFVYSGLPPLPRPSAQTCLPCYTILPSWWWGGKWWNSMKKVFCLASKTTTKKVHMSLFRRIKSIAYI